MKLFANEGILYRGTNKTNPEEVWHYPRKCWVPYREGALDPKRTTEIGAEAAERLKSNNPSAEHYCYYDTPPWSQGLGYIPTRDDE